MGTAVEGLLLDGEGKSTKPQASRLGRDRGSSSHDLATAHAAAAGCTQGARRVRTLARRRHGDGESNRVERGSFAVGAASSETLWAPIPQAALQVP